MAGSESVRTCDLCLKEYQLNSENIPRIIIRQKVVLNDLSAKDSYANPDFCQVCMSYILHILQKKTPLRYSVRNEMINNTYFTKQDNDLLRKIRYR